MPQTVVLPHAQAMVVRILKAAGVVGGRVSGALPASPTYPLILVEHAGASDTEVVAGTAEAVTVQLDAYAAADETEARDAIYAAWEALRAFGHGEVRRADNSLLGWVSAILRANGPQHIAEPGTTRQRYTMQVAVHTRATVTG